MDASNLLQYLNNFASSGVIFSTEQRTCLANSLTLVKYHYKFDRLEFWGKIQGLKEDYYIAQGVRAGLEDATQTLYSVNCSDWCLLEDVVDEQKRAQALSIRGRFTGDPSLPYSLPLDDEDSEKNGELQVLEEVRLSAVVEDINRLAMLRPADALTKENRLNMLWNGLTVDQAANPSNWRYNSGAAVEAKSQRFWSVQAEQGVGVDCMNIVLKNLLYVGAMAFHTPGSNQFGRLYVGNGEKNLNFTFMM